MENPLAVLSSNRTYQKQHYRKKSFPTQLDAIRKILPLTILSKESCPVRPIPAYKAGLHGLTEKRQLSNSNPKSAFIPVHRTGFSACFNKWFSLVENSRSILMKIIECLHRGQLNIRISNSDFFDMSGIQDYSSY